MNNQEANAANLLMLWELGEAIGPYRGTLLSELNAAVDRVAPQYSAASELDADEWDAEHRAKTRGL